MKVAEPPMRVCELRHRRRNELEGAAEMRRLGPAVSSQINDDSSGPTRPCHDGSTGPSSTHAVERSFQQLNGEARVLPGVSVLLIRVAEAAMRWEA
jgi:hypothetical protein